MSHQIELQTELKSIIKDSIGDSSYQSTNRLKADQQEDALIPKQTHENIAQPQPKQQEITQNTQNDIIDPFHELIKNNDVVPLLAVIDKIDIQAIVQYKPLINRLCTMHLPLSRILGDRKFKFQTDSSNRSALHQAIAADDIPAVHFCLQNRIQNTKDIFGMTPILEAIKLGRKAAFLLCLHYHYYDNQVSHMCAKYNRSWQLKVLNQLGYDIINPRDSEFYTPLERAVQNYSFDCAEYLVEIGAKFNPPEIQKKTDSKGIMRLIKRVKKESSAFNRAIVPFFSILINLGIICGLTFLPPFQKISYQLRQGGIYIIILYLIIIIVSSVTSKKSPAPKEGILMDLLQAPHFPPLKDICPYCLKFKQTHKQHCKKCHNCVQRLHFHSFTCINVHNEVFWLLVQVCWLWLLLKINGTYTNSLTAAHLHIISMSTNFFFFNASMLDYLISNLLYVELLQFLYIKIFLIYQLCVIFQWICMLVLQRTHLEINNTQKFKRLYKIGRTNEGSYKSQEIRIMEGGFKQGFKTGLKNIVLYFFN